MDRHDLLQDQITLQIGRSYKVKIASIKLQQIQDKIELHLTLDTMTNERTITSAKKSATFNFQQSSEKVTETLKEQMGNSNSYIEVKIVFINFV